MALSITPHPVSVTPPLKLYESYSIADAAFFNAFFVISRTVGFIAHFLEQKKNDEGLFRLPDHLLFTKE